MQKHSLFGAVSAIVMFVGGVGVAHADTNLWIDDTSGNIGLVDITTGAVTQVNSTGQSLTDIGFIGTQMYGVTFSNLFSINKATGASTVIGSSFSDTGMNALVGFGTQLLGASNSTTNIYDIDPTNATLTVPGFATPLTSSGDLAFSGGSLFESATGDNGADQLVDASTGTIEGQFHTTTTSGFGNVFGLADDGTTMYAVAGTEIYTVDLSSALLTPVLDYSGHGLGAANGTAFLAENNNVVPEPSTWAMMIVGFAGLGFFGYRASRKNAVVA
jgi:PEP-CTERM motif